MADNKKSSISKRSSCYLLNLKQPEKTARRLKLSFQRTSASIVLLKADRTVEGTVGFLDVSETGAGIFTPELLHKGAMVLLCITEPSVLKVRGIVAWSIPVTTGIHAGKFNCRSGIQFVFESEVERVSLQEFVRKAGMDPIEQIKSLNAAAANTTVVTSGQPPGDNTDAGLAKAVEAAKAPDAAAPAAPAEPTVAPAPTVVAEAPSAAAAPAPAEAAPKPAEAPAVAAAPAEEKKAA